MRTTKTEDRPLYPPKFAFVIQFADDGATGERCRGRVEHVVSGHSDRFENRAQLLDLIDQMHREITESAIDSGNDAA